MRRHLLLVAAMLLGTGGEALACTYPLPTRDPKESDAAYEARINPWITNWADNMSRGWQRNAFDDAVRVSLARITSSTGRVDPPSQAGSDSPRPVWEAVAVPFASVKGPLKADPVPLRYELQMRCAVFEQGSGATAPVGALVVLFETDGLGGIVIAEGITADTSNDPRVLAAIAKLPPEPAKPAP